MNRHLISLLCFCVLTDAVPLPMYAQLPLPLSQSVTSSGTAFKITNNGTSPTSHALVGVSTGANGVFGSTRFTGNYSGVGGVAGTNPATGNWGTLGGRFEGVRGYGAAFYNTSGFLRAYDGVIGITRGSILHDGSRHSAGVYGATLDINNGYAGYFAGSVNVTGYLTVGVNVRVKGSATVESDLIVSRNLRVYGTKNFQIDHPLDPANKYLQHAAIESNEPANVYSGNVTLNSKGEATVILPDWFEALNKDFRYQLTCIGGFAPVYVAKEIKNGRFRISGGKAGLKVSWQVTGVRNDAYMKAHPFKAEERKPEAERGRYLDPVAHGQPESLGIR